jgi:hypothetical protein
VSSLYCGYRARSQKIAYGKSLRTAGLPAGHVAISANYSRLAQLKSIKIVAKTRQKRVDFMKMVDLDFQSRPQ